MSNIPTHNGTPASGLSHSNYDRVSISSLLYSFPVGLRDVENSDCTVAQERKPLGKQIWYLAVVAIGASSVALE